MKVFKTICVLLSVFGMVRLEMLAREAIGLIIV